ncbi:MAG: hypothetical protein FWF44_12255, partial [Defluviitaleaceae bacterium]|nr:hypothetical protein [Defluviitaleaceae bacterium]
MDMYDAQTYIPLAVIGDPIGHSLSPLLHGAVFAAAGVNERFDVVRVRPEELEGFIARMRESGEPKGLNVTIPHKERIIPLLDEVRGDAVWAGAVNVVTLENGAARSESHETKSWRLIGHNTDMEGLLRSVRSCG